MTELDVVVEELVGPAGAVDPASVAAALTAEIDRRSLAGELSLPAEAAVDVSRLRISGAGPSTDRLDPGWTAAALARSILDALEGGGGG